MTFDYHKLEKQTSKEVDKIIEKYTDGIDPIVSFLPKKRIGHPRLRDFSIRLGYELANGKNWKDIIPVCAAYELENCSSYVINWIFDEKGGIKTKQEINNLIVAGMQLRELAECILRDFHLQEIISTINDIQRAGYTGQFADLNVLTAEKIGNFKINGFMEKYAERCRNLSGVFHGHCLQSGSIIAGNKLPQLYNIGVSFGSALQASNDLGDFCPPSKKRSLIEKPYHDQFSDLKQGKLTLPVYLLLTRTSNKKRRFIEEKIGKEVTNKDCREIIKYLNETKTFEICYTYLKDRHKELKRTLYRSFESSQQRDMIAQMFSLITSNKFIVELRKQVICNK